MHVCCPKEHVGATSGTHLCCLLAGYLFMLRTDLATNPYGLMVLLCLVTFLSGYFSLGPLKYGVFLLLM